MISDAAVAGLFSNPFVIGGLGSLVGLRLAPEVTWWGRSTSITCGLLTAGYVAPGLTEWLRLPTLVNLFAFMIGLLGMNFLASVYKGITSIDIGAIITGWISRRD